MVLIDTSAWVAFLRDDNPLVSDAVEQLLDGDAFTCDVVVMEVLAGARDEAHLVALRRLMARSTFESVRSDDFEVATSLYRSARRSGVTVRSLNDGVIAAVAVRLGVPVLHVDRDFDALSTCTELRVQRPIA